VLFHADESYMESESWWEINSFKTICIIVRLINLKNAIELKGKVGLWAINVIDSIHKSG
jgi:hypothetical protein